MQGLRGAGLACGGRSCGRRRRGTWKERENKKCSRYGGCCGCGCGPAAAARSFERRGHRSVTERGFSPRMSKLRVCVRCVALPGGLAVGVWAFLDDRRFQTSVAAAAVVVTVVVVADEYRYSNGALPMIYHHHSLSLKSADKQASGVSIHHSM